ncbi:enoyl-CoA hydratase/isomerase family protein [Tessaracoccus antarcticus]|uniref:3-hydroxyisobutyryl-CoA hydrolase n=1 Tax=Tessaracoccus antarcticus TaxID=2479848 RepID=A0A3M0G8W8_9ACTN|nr:enoyl-CoA hydratase/isomerase family protein [Tessaracoccus antarcticus]RMB61480.1 enoyl-CoA hydratase/isomerase family protein [Tessaracoccus antarcticus]
MSELISSRVDDGVGHLELNRPRVINSLNLEMLHAATEILTAFRDDDGVRAVELSGAGDRGFCAGADVRELSGLVTSGGDWLEFLRLEYSLDALVADFPKPVTAHMRGITMGGGLGLAAAASHRTVGHSTYMAMPETKIGFFPDAGVMFYLSRAGGVGTHVALTSAPFSGGDALRMGLADDSFDGSLPAPLVDAAGDWIDECYASDDPTDIVRALERHSHPDARTAARELRARSPFAVHVALRALRLASSLDRDAVLAQDLRVAERTLPVDFVEGVRALLVDKDLTPEWRHARIEDVPAGAVDDVFAA